MSEQPPQLPEQGFDYDHIFNNVGDVALTSIVESNEPKHLDQRQKILFALFTKELPDNSAETQQAGNYDHLFDPNYEQGSVEDARVDLPSQRGLTPSSRAFTEEIYKNNNLDSRVKSIIRKHLAGDEELSAINMTEAVRHNGDLREELAEYLLEKIDYEVNSKVGDRVQDNKQKNPNHIGYERVYVSSREYATLLALSYLDGTYDPDKAATIDTITYNKDGSVQLGQHRHAAYVVLGLNTPTPAE